MYVYICVKHHNKLCKPFVDPMKRPSCLYGLKYMIVNRIFANSKGWVHALT